MFVRYVVISKDSDSQAEQGLIAAAQDLKEGGALTEDEIQLIESTFCWLNKHLLVPHRFSRSRRPNSHNKAISWFKPSAKKYIARIRSLIPVLEEHGHIVRMLTTSRPGYIVYEDNQQIVAEPFRRDAHSG